MMPNLSSSGVPQRELNELVTIYSVAAATFRQIVLHPPGGSSASREFRLGRAALLSRQVDATLAKLAAGTAAWVGRNFPRAAADGIALAERQAVEAGTRVAGRAVTGSFALVDHGTVSVLARDAAADLGLAAKLAGQRAQNLLRQTAQLHLAEADIDRILAGGSVAGTPTQTVRTLRDELRRVAGNTVVVRDKNGGLINFDAGVYAEMVARTKTREATVRARHERLAGLGLNLVSIVGRVSRYFCTAYLGQVFSINGGDGRYPPLSSLPSGGPPFHPNCSKSTRPFVAELASDRQVAAADGAADEASMRGIDAATAQRRYRDLQVESQVRASYATTAGPLFAGAKG